MNRYLQDYKYYLRIEKGLSDNTSGAYLSDLQEFLDFAGEDVATVETEDILAWISARASDAGIGGGPQTKGAGKAHDEEGGISKRTQARMLSALRSFFAWMVIEGERTDNPCDGISAPKLGRYLPSVLSVDEVLAMFESIDIKKAEGIRDRAILEVLYGCGLRVSETVSLKLSDIFMEDGFIRVTGKGNKQRLVPLGENAADALTAYMAVRSEPKANTDADIIFLSRLGKRLSRVSIFNTVKKRAAQAGITKELSPHTFRHSFATHLIENGADLRVVQEMLGHENILTTEIYTHIDTRTWQQTILSHHPLEKSRTKAE